MPTIDAACHLLYTFCKIRGDKAVSRFMDNEPKHIESLLSCLERNNAASLANWHISYCLQIWLGHLLLVPFALAIISDKTAINTPQHELPLPPELPALACRIIACAMQGFKQSPKDQDAAVKMLVTLTTRPDMRHHELTSILVRHACKDVTRSDPTTRIASTAWLKFLAKLSAQLTIAADAPLLLQIYDNALQLEAQYRTKSASTSIASRLLVKIFKAIALATSANADALAVQHKEMLENVIQILLETLADRDTNVRFAAAKALGIIVTHLSANLSYQVIEVVTATLTETTEYAAIATEDISHVHAKCHGFTLTLAFCLSRQSAGQEKLAEIMQALIAALDFDHGVASGRGSVSNVRDAACLGLWSLARRYSTHQLLSISSDRNDAQDLSAIQQIANALLVSACLDPEGNVRRGCSAALQELAGRHPNQVLHGISLIQIVDYQAVGLRTRAMTEVAFAASSLDPLYWDVLVEGLLDWRGACTSDKLAREAAAQSLGRHCRQVSVLKVAHVVETLSEGLLVEQPTTAQHGFLLAASSLIDCRIDQCQRTSNAVDTTDSRLRSDPICKLLTIINHDQTTWREYCQAALRADLFAGVAQLLTAVFRLRAALAIRLELTPTAGANISLTIDGLLSRSDEAILKHLPNMMHAYMIVRRANHGYRSLLDLHVVLRKLEIDKHEPGLRSAGGVIALAAGFWDLTEADPAQDDILTVICSLVHVNAIEWRVIGLQALHEIISACIAENSISQYMHRIQESLLTALNDYTITERGDVGSLVRVEAIRCVSSLWQKCYHLSNVPPSEALRAEVCRLALEKLNRTRLLAAQSLAVDKTADVHVSQPTSVTIASHDELRMADVSSRNYFNKSLSPLRSDQTVDELRSALVRGCISCAGNAQEDLLQACRNAIIDTLLIATPAACLAFMDSFLNLLRSMITSAHDATPALELLSHLLDMLDLASRLGDGFRYVHFKASFCMTITCAQLERPTGTCSEESLQVQHSATLARCCQRLQRTRHDYSAARRGHTQAM